jgi:hypothetical protein
MYEYKILQEYLVLQQDMHTYGFDANCLKIRYNE